MNDYQRSTTKNYCYIHAIYDELIRRSRRDDTPKASVVVFTEQKNKKEGRKEGITKLHIIMHA